MADVIAVLILVVLIGGAEETVLTDGKGKEKNCQDPLLRRKLSLFQECTVNIVFKV